MGKKTIILSSIFAFMLAIAVSGCSQQLKQENEQLKSQVQTLTDENNNLKNQVASLTKTGDDLKAQVASLTQEKDNMKKEIEASKAKGKPAKEATKKKTPTKTKKKR